MDRERLLRLVDTDDPASLSALVTELRRQGLHRRAAVGPATAVAWPAGCGG